MGGCLAVVGSWRGLLGSWLSGWFLAGFGARRLVIGGWYLAGFWYSEVGWAVGAQQLMTVSVCGGGGLYLIVGLRAMAGDDRLLAGGSLTGGSWIAVVF